MQLRQAAGSTISTSNFSGSSSSLALQIEPADDAPGGSVRS